MESNTGRRQHPEHLTQSTRQAPGDLESVRDSTHMRYKRLVDAERIVSEAGSLGATHFYALLVLRTR